MNEGKDVLLSPGTTTIPIEDVETALHILIKRIRGYISSSNVAQGAELCWVGREGQVSYRESTRQQPKKSAETTPAAPLRKFRLSKVETSNLYDILSSAGNNADDTDLMSSLSKKKKKEEGSSVLDNWESFEE